MEIRLNDPMCPLKHIYTIVSEDNIYANIQQYDFPVVMDFDLNNKKKWAKLFESLSALKQFFPTTKIDTVQTPLLYSPPMPFNQVQVLASRIQKFLIEEFQDDRIRQVKKTTKWLVSADSKLRTLLEDCEQHSHYARKGGVNSHFLSDEMKRNQEIKIDDISKTLHSLHVDKKRCWGFPLNCTFVSLEHLWKQVQSTKIHTVNRQDVEFALSVHIDSLPSNVLSVWIYLAAFVDKETSEVTLNTR